MRQPKADLATPWDRDLEGRDPREQVDFLINNIADRMDGNTGNHFKQLAIQTALGVMTTSGIIRGDQAQLVREAIARDDLNGAANILKRNNNK